MLPECLDDYIDENNPVRVVDAFVEELDLQDLDLKAYSRQRLGVLRTIPLSFSSSTSTAI